MIRLWLYITLFMTASSAMAQTKSITLEEIWGEHKFSAAHVKGFNFLKDGRHYTVLEDNKINQYDVTNGEFVKTIFDANSIKGELSFVGPMQGYHFSGDERKILIESEKQSIFRRSYLAKYHVYDLRTNELQALYEEGMVRDASFSPDASKVAYVFNNNIYYLDLVDGMTYPVTSDGVRNEIINGSTDWVYEEELSLVKAYWWSPDGENIAYLRFDESQVPEFTMTYHMDQLYPVQYNFKYPKVGEKNSEVTVHLYNLTEETNEKIDIGDFEDGYIPRVKWTQDPDLLCVFTMNRHQNHLQLWLHDVETEEQRILLEEKNPYYIDIHDNLQFLADGEHFVWTSEKSGYNHAYLYKMSGELESALTEGEYDVTEFYGVDEKNGLAYYQAAKESPLRRAIYQVKLNGKKEKRLTSDMGVYNAAFSSTFDYYTLKHSTINTPESARVYDRKGKMIRDLEANDELKAKQAEYGAQPLKFFSFTTDEDVQLNGWMLKPSDFDPEKEYPVLMVQYSGPGSQMVLDSWRGTNYWWYQSLAERGFIIACVDGRGTGARGQEFKKCTYLQLGHHETKDQIAAAEYLGALPYVDAKRIGIFGWSYGGYMSSLCILKGNDVFSTAIAVAPVTNWKWYDTIYTERYMRTVEENEDGYRQNSPVYFTDSLKGNYLLVHGSADDNVHPQHSMEMARALIGSNKQFDMYFYPNRNHAIYGGNARLHLYTKMTNFLEENL